MNFFDKLSGFNYLNEFINFNNSASSLDELDVTQIGWREAIFNKYIDSVGNPNKTCNFHVLNGANDSEVTSVESINVTTKSCKK